MYINLTIFLISLKSSKVFTRYLNVKLNILEIQDDINTINKPDKVTTTLEKNINRIES